MSTNARDRPIIHAPPDLDLAAMVRVDASLGELTDDEIAAVTIFDTEHQLVSTNARDDQVRAVLLDAAKLVERGWCQGVHKKHTPKGARYCLSGAINEAVDELETPPFQARCELRDRARKAVTAAIGARTLFHWNDALERTQAEVVAALRGAAESIGKESGE